MAKLGEFKDLTGSKIGNLIIISFYDRYGKYKQIRWKCKCKCGKEVIKSTYYLKKYKERCNCGCVTKQWATLKYKKDITNQTFGRVTVIKDAGQRKQGGYLWLCKCECGKEFVTFGGHLRSGSTTSCGCKRKEFPKGENSRSWKGGRFTDKQGYVNIYSLDHPNANKTYIKEHIKVMSDFIGRPLTKKETVHHKNGIRNDNRIENLELWSSDHGSGQRVEDLINHSIYLLDKYKNLLTNKNKIKIKKVLND